MRPASRASCCPRDLALSLSAGVPTVVTIPSGRGSCVCVPEVFPTHAAVRVVDPFLLQPASDSSVAYVAKSRHTARGSRESEVGCVSGVSNWNADDLPAVDVDPNKSVHHSWSVFVAAATSPAYANGILVVAGRSRSLDLKPPAPPLVVREKVTSVVHDRDGDHEAIA